MQIPSCVSLRIRIAVAALAVAAAIGAARGQTVANGVIGQRYVDVSFATVDYNGLNPNAYSSGVSLNLPAAPNLDFGLSYGYGWFNSSVQTLREHTVSASTVWYGTVNNVKPFVGVGLGYDWTRNRFAHASLNDGTGIWGASLGVEIVTGNFTLLPRISYVDLTRSHSIGAMHYGAEADYWFTADVAGYAGATFVDYTGAHGSAWVYSVGLKLKF